MKIWKRRAAGQETAAGPVQLRGSERHPFALLDGYVPLHEPAFGLYRAIREAVPVVDAAVLKLVRLAGGVRVSCADKGLEKRLAEFLRTVPVGWNQVGLQAFLDSYLDCLLTCGKAVGEVVPTRDGRGVAAVLCGNVSDVQIQEGEDPLSCKLARKEADGSMTVLPRQELLLFTPYHPDAEHPYGVSLLHSLPFLSGVLLKIWQTLGANWERAGNVRWSRSRAARDWTPDRCRAGPVSWPRGGARRCPPPVEGRCGILWRWGMWKLKSLEPSVRSPTVRPRCGCSWSSSLPRRASRRFCWG